MRVTFTTVVSVAGVVTVISDRVLPSFLSRHHRLNLIDAGRVTLNVNGFRFGIESQSPSQAEIVAATG